MESESAAADIAMDVFGSNPLEIIALNFLSTGLLTFVNNFWTWLADATAAISFWRFSRRSAAPTTTTAATASPLPPPSLDDKQTSTAASEKLPEKNELAYQGSIKFTVYYDEDSYQDDDNDNRSENRFARCDPVIIEDDREGLFHELQEEDYNSMEKWEVVLKWKTGEISSRSGPGWYSHQDLTNFNGNVVRLWDAPKSPTLRRFCWSVIEVR